MSRQIVVVEQDRDEYKEDVIERALKLLDKYDVLIQLRQPELSKYSELFTEDELKCKTQNSDKLRKGI